MAQKEMSKKPARVATIQTEYVRSLQKKVDRRKAQKVRLFRRLSVFAIAAIIILGVLTNTFFNQKQVLAMKKQEREELLVELAEVENEQEILTRKIEQLNDDDYIAKLARQEYFLSDKNEIIFSIPKTKEADQKKSDKKE